jgi:hypothetical protein
VLEGVQFECRAVRESSYKISVQTLVDMRVVDDVEGSNGERKGGCLDAAANNNLGLVCQALLRLILVGELRLENLLENGLFGVVCFQRLAAHDATDVVPLILAESMQIQQCLLNLTYLLEFDD